MSILAQSVLLAIVTAIVPADWLTGTSNISRPLVTGTLTGLVMGDLKTGIIMGATIELAFMGAITIGASRPPDVIAGGILGTAFAIATGKGAGFAITLAFPVAALYLIIDNLLTILILPIFLRRGDKYADEGDSKHLNRMNWYGFITVKSLPRALFVGLAFYLGGPVMTRLLNMIPDFVQNGINVAAGIMPALGFALLLQMILKKNVAIYFVLGFALYSYLKIPILGISIFAACLMYIILHLESRIDANGKGDLPGGDDNEF
ncbi:PTS mannose/fructose/sorbose/N-acetylgalactosamine transporter subunit IIC [Ligilactobacillus pobuzihii]|uniref:PTS mannose/fructose/sorbose/N-acetylgalactosamine transporter subunit IIC n=1 Tax=Ligilactobacillus pobuzihii TaxID=449659 RepID=UPI0003716D39|nr:PTS sugar transporter subunit IIC [Ligilactobacillus pobuzihii]GEN48876.1 PTS sugar transporter [Ligilactobacillus pobuzihii]